MGLEQPTIQESLEEMGDFTINEVKEEPVKVEVVEEELPFPINGVTETTTEESGEVAVVTQTQNLPDYAILNPEIPMSVKVKVATNVADILAPLVRNQGLALKGLNKKDPEKEYVTVEGWEVLGTILGITPVTKIIAEIKNDNGRVVGYRARATLYRDPIIQNDEIVGGTIVARAEAQADKTGRQKELFSIASMSQTRALGKAYRMGLSWIMKMAGFEATPAEEMESFKQ